MIGRNLLEKWDKDAPRLIGDTSYRRYLKAIRYLSIDPRRDPIIVDVGCGKGRCLEILRNLGFLELVGTELSIIQLKSAKKRVKHCHYVLCDAMNLPFVSEIFDCVISTAVIEHVRIPEKVVSEISRIIKRSCDVIMSSDCYIWKILQRLGIYRSPQPTDEPLHPKRLFEMFDKNNLRLVHYDAWGKPWAVLLPVIASWVNRVIPSSLRGKAKETYQICIKGPKMLSSEGKPKKVSTAALLKTILFAENVFYLKKR